MNIINISMTHLIKPTISVIGPGLVGSALVRALSGNGFTIKSIYSRNDPSFYENMEQFKGLWVQGLPTIQEHPGDILFVTTPDEAVEPVANKLAKCGIEWAGKSVVHCSGSLMSESLSELKRMGANIASFHPIQTFAVDSGENLFRDITVSIQGDEELSLTLKHIAHSLNAHPVLLSGHQKRMLHIAAVFMSNYTVALAGIADQIIRESTGEGDHSMLNPLLTQTASNISNMGLQGALTGPVARGDVKTINDHLILLEKFPDLKILYKQLGYKLIDLLPDNKSISSGQLNSMRNLLREADPGK